MSRGDSRSGNNFFVKVKVKSVTAGLIILGLLFILLAQLQVDLTKYTYWKVMSDLLSVIGTTLFSAGLVSVIIEISTIKNIVKIALNELLDCNFPLESYSDENLAYLNKRIASIRSERDMTVEYIENSIYSLEPKMLEMSSGLYYSHHIRHTTVIPDVKNNVFRKSVVLKYELINNFGLDNKIFHSFMLYDTSPNMTDEERKKKFKVTKFTINKDDLTGEVDNLISINSIKRSNKTTYEYEVIFNRKLQTCKKHKVTLEFEYEVPIFDVTQTYKANLPCKRLEHTTHIKMDVTTKEEWGLQGSAFTSFFCDTSEKDSGFEVEQNEDTLIKVNFNNWVIPGAGYVIYFKRI